MHFGGTTPHLPHSLRFDLVAAARRRRGKGNSSPSLGRRWGPPLTAAGPAGRRGAAPVRPRGTHRLPILQII